MKENKLEHPCFPQPVDAEIKVWRHMDIGKFIDILKRKSLFFSRLDLLGDPLEGSITKVFFYARQMELENIGMSDDIPQFSKLNQRMNKSMFVNSWYCNDSESEAMWKLYCSNNDGIAIQTTYNKLVSSVNYDEQIYIGLVKYVDYDKDWFPSGNVFYPVMHKRKAFEHEREIRLVKTVSELWSGKKEYPTGIHCFWEIDKFIENIYVNPYAPEWYFEVVTDILEKYNCRLNIKWSVIKGMPYY